jgi:hypothetical protein
MTLLALELNDARLILARGSADGGEPIAESEGYAVLEGPNVLTGDAARSRARLTPLYSYNRFWRELSVLELPRPNARAHTAADLAFAHLDGMLAPFRAGSPELLLALPAGYSREQLGLLLGVAAECGVPVCGIVDSAVAAAAPEPVGARVLHLDLELHHAVLTALDRDSELRRSHSELLPRHGLLALQEAWIEMIAATFVRRTRFDPLHQASNEQDLWNRLPGWIAELESSERIDVELSDERATHTVELTRESLLSATGPLYEGLLRFVQRMCPAGVSTDLLLSDRAAGAPGLAAQLASVPGVSVRPLARGAAALAALRFAGEIRRPAGQVVLVTHLTGTGQAPAAGDARRVDYQVPIGEQPTHLVYEGRALAISAVPLAVGWSVPSGERTLHVPAAPGVSRNHCSFVRRDGNTLLEDHSTYGTYVNDSPVRGVVALRVGDRVKLGNPGVSLGLIRLVDDHATPPQV